MLVINASVKDWIDSIVYIKAQIQENTTLFKVIELDLENVSNKDLITLLTRYPEGALSGLCCGEYDDQCDTVNLFYNYNRPYTIGEQTEEDQCRLNSVKYYQNKIKKYVLRKEENKVQVELYLKSKKLEYILN